MSETTAIDDERTQKRRFDQGQYDFLRQCSEKGEEGIQMWNRWRRENRTQEILLEGADLNHFYLCGADLGREPESRVQVHLEKAGIRDSMLDGANLWSARLDGAHVRRTSMRHARLQSAYLRGTVLLEVDLRGTNIRRTIVDSETYIMYCPVDRMTDIRDTPLGAIRIDPTLKQLLEYNGRRTNWEKWYGDKEEPIPNGAFVLRNARIRLFMNRFLKSLVQSFWEISDYGISTKRIIWTFFKWATLFAIVYYGVGALDYYLAGNRMHAGIVSSLFSGKEGPVPHWLVPIRAVYFSVVTMTTLGFGDMHANCQSFWGHVLLTLQVLLGYVLLGALVTRFAVLFTAGGPAGRFAEAEPKATGKQTKGQKSEKGEAGA